MADYSNAKVYGLYLKSDDTLLYVGSTAHLPNKRLSNHKAQSKRRPNLKLYAYIAEHGGWDGVEMRVIENYPCDNKRALLLREGHYIQTHKPLCNILIAGRTPGECVKAWMQRNREKWNAYMRARYANRKAASST